LDDPLPKLCPAVALSRQDVHHSAVALLLKAALIQVSDYRLLGASGLKLGSLQVLPWNLRQLISYFCALIIYSINLLKTSRKTFATGNAIYPLPRTIIQITNDNSIFRKERINGFRAWKFQNACRCHGNRKNTQFNTKVNNNLLRFRNFKMAAIAMEIIFEFTA
jgi:hypothetical protein